MWSLGVNKVERKKTNNIQKENITFKRNEEGNTYERRTNQELRVMINEPNLVGIFKSKRLSWTGVTSGEQKVKLHVRSQYGNN